MRITEKGEPSHNYSIMKSVLIPHDPLDGREKLVLSNYAAEGVGRILIIDAETLEGECYELPDDSGAWALLWLPERGELLVGTCDHYGSLHCFQMEQRRFLRPLRIETETYLWNFALGGDGCVYAGTYPGCVLVKYDPEKRTLVSLGKVGDVDKNQYSRPIFATSAGDIAISAGFYKNQAWLYRINTGRFLKLGKDGDSVRGVGDDFICLASGVFLTFIDSVTLDPIGTPISADCPEDSPEIGRDSIRRFLAEEIHPAAVPGFPGHGSGIKTSSGRIIGVKGQELYVWENGKASYRRIPGDPPSTAIMTVAAADGEIWGSSENGQTLFCYNTNTGALKNTGAVANSGGEVYGIVPLGGKLFLTAYVGGDHIIYDPAQPWDQHGNVNPRTLRSVAPLMVRPHAKSVLGPDGGVWTGWYANYGSFGGGISRIDPETCEVSSWFGLIPEQAIEHIAAGRDALFALTSGSASGMADREDSFHLLKIGVDGAIIKKRQFARGITLRRLAVVEGRVYVILGEKAANYCRIDVFDEETLEEITSFPLGEAGILPSDLLPAGNDRLLLFTLREILLFSLPDGKIFDRCPSPGLVQTCTLAPDGTVWFAVRRKLFMLEI